MSSEIEPNFERFLPSQILRGRCPPKSCIGVITPRIGTSRDKALLGCTPSSEDFEAHTLNFKAILDPLLKKL